MENNLVNSSVTRLSYLWDIYELIVYFDLTFKCFGFLSLLPARSKNVTNLIYF